MKASKFIVLVGGILGILAFFLPLVSVHLGDFRGTVSGLQVMKGLDQVSVSVDNAESRASMDVETSHEAREGVGKIKMIVGAVFAPALLLTLIGGLGVGRKRFGRGAGTLSLLLGLVGLGIAAICHAASDGNAGIGITFLFVTAIAGIVGGVLALAKPERALATA
jgi:hypothetical protein